MIIVDKVSKSFGRQTIFENISFKVNRRERVGVVGRNGHGKTTLFRLIAGEEECDSGAITRPRNYRIGYVEQQLCFTEKTVLAEASKFLDQAQRNELWRVQKVLSGLGFEKDDMEKNPLELSGGFQVRLNLAKVLLGNYQMLLLDEPTNFLDITSIRWLEQFLRSWPGEIMFITHDRSFMDSVATHVLGIHRKKVRKSEGTTEKYYEQIASDEEVYEKTRINDERKLKEMEVFISRFRAKARLAGLVQSRIKCLEKMEKKVKLDKIQSLDFSFACKPAYPKYLMSCQDLTFAYDFNRPLFQNFSINIGARDRVFVIGQNGRGKTTLLKLMAGILAPQKGEITVAQSVSIGYFEQSMVSSLSENRTVLDEIVAADPEGDPRRARFIAASMMFEGEDALKPIRVLSGGEKSRVLLGKLMARPVNLLLLDEPTNHLDLESNDALFSALVNFDGAVVMVTHNEMFLHGLAERLVVCQASGPVVYELDYQRFLEKIGWQEENQPVQSGRLQTQLTDKMNPKEARRLRSEFILKRSKALTPVEKKMKELEAEIEARDKLLEELNRQAVEAARLRQGKRIGEISREIHETKTVLNGLLVELEKVTDEFDVLKKDYDRQWQELEALIDKKNRALKF